MGSKQDDRIVCRVATAVPRLRNLVRIMFRVGPAHDPQLDGKHKPPLGRGQDDRIACRILIAVSRLRNLVRI